MDRLAGRVSTRHLRPDRITMSVSLPRSPVCPCCSNLLAEAGLRIVDNVAICVQCAYDRRNPPTAVQQAIHDHRFLPHVTAHYGISWFCPAIPGPPNVMGLAAEIAPDLLPSTRYVGPPDN